MDLSSWFPFVNSANFLTSLSVKFYENKKILLLLKLTSSIGITLQGHCVGPPGVERNKVLL
jgi:hypothetical protein